MKKSRIIVPALAMLTLSVAASVTGTVAWFTASRTASMKASSVSVMNATGDLNISLAPGLNTTVKDGKIVNTPLMDASVNVGALSGNVATAANVDVYTANINSDNEITSLAAHKGDYSRSIKEGGTTTPVFAVNTWTAEFSTSSVSNNHLFFDTRLANSNLMDSLSETDGAKSAYRALRVCMFTVGQEEQKGHKLVWAPYTFEPTVYNAKGSGNMAANVLVNAGFDAKKYGVGLVEATGNAIKAEQPIVKSGDTLASANANKTLLSDALSATTSVTVSFVLWFEGLDSNCVSTAQEISSIKTAVSKTLNLSFYSVDSTTLTGPAA